jgi:hypothetical protein
MARLGASSPVICQWPKMAGMLPIAFNEPVLPGGIFEERQPVTGAGFVPRLSYFQPLYSITDGANVD